jgi:hypothetical protein
MINIDRITNDFFNKTPKEQLLIERIFFFDCMKIIQENEISILDCEINMEQIINTAASNEDYEVSELFKRVNNKLKEINYGYKL